MSGPLPRLRQRSDFVRVARHCRKWAAPGLVLQASRQPREPDDAGKTGEHTVRVGFTVTKKLGNAVIRNRIRRRLRAAADQVMPARAKKGYDYVVIGRAQTLSRSFSALMDDLETALQRTDACEGGDGARAS